MFSDALPCSSSIWWTSIDPLVSLYRHVPHPAVPTEPHCTPPITITCVTGRINQGAGGFIEPQQQSDPSNNQLFINSSRQAVGKSSFYNSLQCVLQVQVFTISNRVRHWSVFVLVQMRPTAGYTSLPSRDTSSVYPANCAVATLAGACQNPPSSRFFFQ